MKKVLFLLTLFLILGSGFFGHSLLNTMAEEQETSRTVICYKSIEIEKGDTLWAIAEEYAPDMNMTVTDYIKQLKQMNHLGEDTIHAGCYLTVMYREDAIQESLVKR